MYSNVNSEKPIESTFEFPLDKDVVVSKLICIIDDKVVEAKVQNKEEAKQKYDDAIASGKAAVYAERKTEKKESVTLLLGNLLPDQDATVTLQFIQNVTIEGGSFAFKMPTSFCPQYKKHPRAQIHNCRPVDKENEDEVPKYTFGYSIEVRTQKKITDIIKPSGTKLNEVEKGHYFRIECDSTQKTPRKEVAVYWKTVDMGQPLLNFEIDPSYPGEVACMASFVPTFAPRCEPQEAIEVHEDEKPEELELCNGAEY